MRQRNELVTTQRPNRRIIRQRLSNGAYMTLFLKRERASRIWDDYEQDEPLFVWWVGLYIGSWEEARAWNRSKIKRDITGDGSLEGLHTASRHLLRFCQRLGANETLIIEGADTRRIHAYRRLMRQYEGFSEGVNPNTGEDSLMYRNPEFWIWRLDDEKA